MLKRVSIIMASCNMFSGTQCAVDAIRRFIPAEKREIIVVDNGSRPEIIHWLQVQPDVQLMVNTVNKGLAGAWNQGAVVATGEMLLFMHNDVLLSPEAFSIMEGTLWENERLGAVVPCTNRCNMFYQFVDNVPYKNIEGMWDFAAQYSQHNAVNIPLMLMDDVCILMKREAFAKTGLFDEVFKASGYEAYDYSVRMLQCGYELVCTPAYVHHEPGSYIENKWARQAFMAVNREHFQKKWGFTAEYSMLVREDLLNLVDWQQEGISVLDIGCSCGGNLMAIRAKCPDAELYGIELNQSAAAVAEVFGQIKAMDAEKMDEPAWRERFDYVITADLLEHLNDPWQAVSNIYKLLKPGGALLASLPNVQHISVVMDLLHGFWHYEEAGILDRTHLRFFTRNSVAEMIVQAGFKDVKIVSKQIPLATEQEEYLRLLQTQPGVGTDEDNLRTYQWLVVARR